MQLHRQLPELRKGGTRGGEDLSNLGAEQHYGGPQHTPAPSGRDALAPPQVHLPPGAEEPGANWGTPPSRGRQGALSAWEVEPLWTLTSWPRAPPHGDAAAAAAATTEPGPRREGRSNGSNTRRKSRPSS